MPSEGSGYYELVSSIPTLSDEISASLEKTFFIEEIEISIKNRKLNRATGPDGFFRMSFKKYFREEF